MRTIRTFIVGLIMMVAVLASAGMAQARPVIDPGFDCSHGYHMVDNRCVEKLPVPPDQSAGGWILAALGVALLFGLL